MKPDRRNPLRHKTDVNRDNSDPKETQNHDSQVTQDVSAIQMDPQVTQEVPTMKMALTRVINNLNNAMNELRYDLKQLVTRTSNKITSTSSAVENFQVYMHEINTTKTEQMNLNIQDLDSNNKEDFISMIDTLAI